MSSKTELIEEYNAYKILLTSAVLREDWKTVDDIQEKINSIKEEIKTCPEKIDSISPLEAQCRRLKRTEMLKSVIKSKGWKIKDVAERWELTPRRMSQILKEPSYKEIDAIYGLPQKSVFS